MEQVSESASKAIPVTATATFTPMNMIGFHVSSVSGTIAISDGASAVITAFSPNIGFNPFPYRFRTSVAVTVTGTISATLLGN